MSWADLLYSIRSLARTPALTLTLLLTIALGIGSNASVAGFVRGLATRNLPPAGMGDVVSLFARDAQDAFGPVSYADYLSLETQSGAFEWLGAARESRRSIVIGDRWSVASVAAITPEMAKLLQLDLHDGVVISHRMWQSEFGGAAGARGALVLIDDIRSRVAGIAPEWLEGLYAGSDVDIWMTLQEPAQDDDRVSRTLWVLGRLQPGISPNRAQAVANQARKEGDIIAVLPYTRLTPEVSGGMARMTTLLTAAAWGVFFIACANVATFLLSRASARARETSVRVALGASRGRLATQFLSDAVVISLGGGALGVLLAVWTSQIVPALLFEEDAEHLVFVPDLAGTVSAAIACIAIMIVCGLAPLLETRRDQPARVLQRENAGPSILMRRFRAALVAAQMTWCCLLLISAATLVTGFGAALQTMGGDHLKQSVLATLESRFRFSRPDLGLSYFNNSEQAVRSLRGVFSAAWSAKAPGTRPTWQSIRIEPAQLPTQDVVLNVAAFTPRSLATVTVPPIAGRMFGAVDTAQSCRVALVNERAAGDLFGSDAVGRSIEDPAGQRVEIIGVVSTPATPGPTIYYYAEQTPPPLDHEGPARFRVPMRPQPKRAVLDANSVSRSYFDVMGFASIDGRIFPDEPAPRSCRVAVVNQEANERYFAGRAVGAAIIDGAGRRTEIVGVVHSRLLRASQRRAEAGIYFPMAQDFLPMMTMIVGASEANEATVAALRTTLDSVPGGRVPAVVRTLADHLSRVAMAPERIAMALVGAAAATALVLGALGLYGAMSDAARQRRREFGVRIALGSQGWRLIRQVLAEGIRLASVGSAAGLLASMLVARWLAQINPTAGAPTVWVWIGAPLALLAAVAIASVLPARRVLATDPLTIMRDE